MNELKVQHGRTIRLGQVWQSNDPRRLRAVRVEQIGPWQSDRIPIYCRDIVTGRPTWISSTSFTIGQRGWSLLRDAARRRCIMGQCNRAAAPDDRLCGVHQFKPEQSPEYFIGFIRSSV